MSKNHRSLNQDHFKVGGTAAEDRDQVRMAHQATALERARERENGVGGELQKKRHGASAAGTKSGRKRKAPAAATPVAASQYPTPPLERVIDSAMGAAEAAAAPARDAAHAMRQAGAEAGRAQAGRVNAAGSGASRSLVGRIVSGALHPFSTMRAVIASVWEWLPGHHSHLQTS